MNQSIEQSIKEKLKNISKKQNIPFNSLLETLLLERFLVRVAKSKYADKLIFKGGMCLAQFIKLERETKDIDFLLNQLDAGMNDIESMMREISAVKVGDGLLFSLMRVSQLSIEHKKYPGYRISVQAELGQIKNKVSIDIGVGDIVRPRTLEVTLLKTKDPLFEESISLLAYPAEYIFSEKLEAILYHGELGSRMKDFYDCYRMIKDGILDDDLLRMALKETTANRGTKLRAIAENSKPFLNLWKNFIRMNKLDNYQLDEIIKIINSKLKSVLIKLDSD